MNLWKGAQVRWVLVEVADVEGEREAGDEAGLAYKDPNIQPEAFCRQRQPNRCGSPRQRNDRQLRARQCPQAFAARTRQQGIPQRQRTGASGHRQEARPLWRAVGHQRAGGSQGHRSPNQQARPRIPVEGSAARGRELVGVAPPFDPALGGVGPAGEGSDPPSHRVTPGFQARESRLVQRGCSASSGAEGNDEVGNFQRT